MKKVLFLIILLIIASCSIKKDELPLKKVIIAGKVLNQDPRVFEIRFILNHIGFGKESLPTSFKDDGSFKVTFNSNIPADVWLSYKMNFLILTHPGDSIYLEFDGSKEERLDILKTVRFSGDASNLNNEVAAFQQKYFARSILYSYWDKRQQILRDYNEIQYKLFADSIRNENTGIYKQFLKDNNPSYEARNWASIFLDADYYKDLIAFPEFHRMANNLKEVDWNVPITYYDFLKPLLPLNDSNLISGYSIYSFVNTYPVYLYQKIRDENKQFFSSTDSLLKYPEKADSLWFFGTIKYTDDPLLRQMVLTETLQQRLNQSEIRMFEKYENLIEKYITKSYLKEPLFNLYRQTLSRLDNPKLASDAILSKLNGTSLKSDIDSIISTNKGKVIYMDCWATWCGPCIAEMPNSKKLMEQYKRKQLAFVFICLDSNEQNWKSIISKYSIGGQHFLLTKTQSNDFRKVFGINGVPHYILFDKKGNISENGTESPLFIKEKIDKLLSEK
jgi:thiol-disulfide isomerase/thioredoxin